MKMAKKNKKSKSRKSAKSEKRIKSKAKKPIKKKLITPLYKKQKSSESGFLIAVLAILIILFFVSSFYNKYKMNSEANSIINKIVVGDEIDEQALSKFMNTDYNKLKKELGITRDFIIHFEDENENSIQINGMYGFGYEQSP